MEMHCKSTSSVLWYFLLRTPAKENNDLICNHDLEKQRRMEGIIILGIVVSLQNHTIPSAKSDHDIFVVYGPFSNIILSANFQQKPINDHQDPNPPQPHIEYPHMSPGKNCASQHQHQQQWPRRFDPTPL